ncbi:MAG TPA: UdgX family uracil-DNA binding protein [Caulobacteraceae bacterium]|jgi:DNA polymerase
MPTVLLSGETDFDGWRDAARRLRGAGVAPAEVAWSAGGDLFGSAPDALPEAPAFPVPAAFVNLAQDVVLHRSAERWDVLYRLLWRLRDEPRLLALASDPDVQQALHLQREVSQASHKMKAFVRFRAAPHPQGEAFAAWFEPPHRVVEKTAPFFVRRFAQMRFSILTPELCAHWDGQVLAFSPGEDRASIPPPDALEAAWTLYYASIFNPARLNERMMRKEMPERYWRNLPEAALIPGLIAEAEERTGAMVQARPTTPKRRVSGKAPAKAAVEVGPDESPLASDLEALAALVQGCRRCDLWRDATQAVTGEGPADAPLMLVGEQPGDQEDLAGRAFIGPAGEMLNRALVAAGVDRSKLYITNAVKHFKYSPRGKRRLHKTPDRGEVLACRWWLDNERRLVRPRMILALGATAAFSMIGKPAPVMKMRGQVIQLEDQIQGMVTLHPSFLLRMPDPKAKAEGFEMLVADLEAAARLAGV